MTSKNKKSIVIHNIKNSSFRQIHVDGAHGGITPTGLININFYSQRNAIPKGTEFNLTSKGELGSIVKDIDDSKVGIVREFEFGAYMDLNTCISLKQFLEKKIDEFREITNGKNKDK